MNAARTYDVIVIGAGIQGCATAFNLSSRRRVLLIEKKFAGREASGVNAGGVRRLYRAPEEIPLSLAAMELWPGLEKRLGAPCGFKASGQVKIAENADEMRTLEARAGLVASLGYSHEELIDADELRSIVPAAAPTCVGALISREDGFAEPYWTTRAFLSAARANGVELVEQMPVIGLEHRSGMWHVHCPEIAWQAPVVVNCAGAWAGRLARMVGDNVPLKPESPTMMVTARVPHFLDPVVGLVSRKLSFKQMPNGSVVIGGGHRSQLDMRTERTIISFRELQVSARTVLAVFPFMGEVPIIRCWAGIEGMLPDHLPVIGASPSAPGLFHAFGFSAHGFQLGPIVGRVMAELIENGKSAIPIDAFRIDRFQ